MAHRMHYLFPLAVLFAGVVVLSMPMSVLLMDHRGAGDHGGCVAATASGVACPWELDLLQFVNLHMNFLGQFVGTFPASALSFLVLAFGMLLSSLLLGLPGPGRSLRALRERSFEIRRVSTKKFTRWLARHERRDPSVLPAMSA